jgi:hypothetical protein
VINFILEDTENQYFDNEKNGDFMKNGVWKKRGFLDSLTVCGLVVAYAPKNTN